MTSSLSIIGKTCIIQIKNSFARSMFRYCLVIQPVIYCFITYMMYKASGIDNFASFVILGSGILTLWSCICFSSAGDIERERYMGTLEIVYGSPTSFKTVVVGKILGNTTLGLFPLALSFLLAIFIFREPFHIVNPLLFVISLFATITAFICISFVFMAFFTVSRSAGILMNCMEFPIFILCGFIVPIEKLPSFILPVCYILSPTWAMKLLRMSVEGGYDFSYYIECLLILLTLCTIYLVCSYFLFIKMDKMVRISGSLGVK